MNTRAGTATNRRLEGADLTDRPHLAEVPQYRKREEDQQEGTVTVRRLGLWEETRVVCPETGFAFPSLGRSARRSAISSKGLVAVRWMLPVGPGRPRPIVGKFAAIVGRFGPIVRPVSRKRGEGADEWSSVMATGTVPWWREAFPR